MSWDEDRLHRWIAKHLAPRALAGSTGHDAAVLAALGSGRPTLCVDQTVEGVHWDVGTAPRWVGRKAVDRVLSDLAASAARPVAVLIALQAPAATQSAWIQRVLRAAAERASRFGAQLVGGDLCAAPGPIALAVTAFGEVPAGRRPPGRDRARPGQRVFLTGPVGGSRRRRHLAFEPRVEAGRRLWEAGATALMDVSDGLAFDLFRMARAAGVSIELDLEALPIHADARRAAATSGRTPLDHALHDGEDHELLACGPAGLAGLRGEGSAGRGASGGDAPWCALAVGRVRAGRGLILVDGTRRRRWKPAEGGWCHGGR